MSEQARDWDDICVRLSALYPSAVAQEAVFLIQQLRVEMQYMQQESEAVLAFMEKAKEYFGHKPDCAIIEGQDCSCGFTALIHSLQEAA